MIQVKIIATNGHHRTLMKVGAKSRDLAKSSQNISKIVNILFDRSQEDGCIIRIKGGSHHGTPTPNFVEEPLSRSHIKDSLERVNGDDEQKRGDGVPLPETTTMLDWVAGNAIEDNPR